jgi:hypothetical protein
VIAVRSLTLVLLAVALVACVIPAKRAVRVGSDRRAAL